MSQYVYGIICASVAVGIAETLIPENAKTRAYLRLIFGLAVLLVIIKPIGGLAARLPQFSEEFFGDSSVGDEYAEIANGQLGEAYEKGISEALEESFGLSEFEVGVLMGDGRKPKRVTVTLLGKEIFRNPYVIEEYISKAFECDCVVIIG